MAPTDPPKHGQEGEDNEEYINDGDVFVEIDQGDDEPMDEDDEDAGGVGDEIVWEDNSIQQFTVHEGPVYAVSAHPTAPVAASGGGDDFGYIWDVTDGETIVKLTGHSDSVTATAFSSDGEMVSTGGMDGRVRVWKRVGTDDYKSWEFLTELQGPDEVMVRPSAMRRCRHKKFTHSDLIFYSGYVGIPKERHCWLALTTAQFGYGNVWQCHGAQSDESSSHLYRSAVRQYYASFCRPHRASSVWRFYSRR